MMDGKILAWLYSFTIFFICIKRTLLIVVEITNLKDATELDQLISYLINKEDSEGVVLLGHSTGCQVSAD